MLDLDHLLTPHVFAASVQEELILQYGKRITLSGRSRRIFLVEVVRPAFAALRWLANHRFADRPQIADRIAELEQQLEQLAELHLRDEDFTELPGANCPVCGGKPTGPNKDNPTPYCMSCLGIIMPGLERVRSGEEGFGTDFI